MDYLSHMVSTAVLYSVKPWHIQYILPVHRYPEPYVMALSCGQWFMGHVIFVYIGRIVDHYCLNVHFIIHVLISSFYIFVLLLWKYVI